MNRKTLSKSAHIKALIWLSLGVLFLGYYISSVLFGGFALSFIWIWVAGGAVCIAFSALTFHYGRLPIPKTLFRIFLVLVLLVALLFLASEICILSYMFSDGAEGLDYIIILGAAVRGTTPSSTLYWRIDAAYDYLTKNPRTIAILSGGQGPGEAISEAECMYRVLTERGIEPERLIQEAKSTSTNENLRYSFELIEEGRTIGIVTSNFHIFRAVKIAEKIFGVPVSGIAAPHKNSLLPHYMVREFAGLVSDTLRGNIF